MLERFRREVKLARRVTHKPAQSEARVALGFLRLHHDGSTEAALELMRALALAPNAVEALDLVGRLLIEVGRWKTGMETLRRALAVEPMMLHARDAIARAHFLDGDTDAALEVLGPIPIEANDFGRHMLIRGRMLLMKPDRDEGNRLRALLSEAHVSELSRRNLRDIYELASTGIASPRVDRALEVGLPLDHRFPPRRRAFHAQLRAEVRMAGGDVDGTLNELAAADECDLLDLFWLDRVPAFDVLRTRPEFLAIRESTAARAERVAAILDTPTAAPALRA